MSKTRSYEQSISGMVRTFTEICAERDRLTVELVELLASIRAMSLLSGEAGGSEPYVTELAERIWQPKPPLTAAIEHLLRSAKQPMAPVEIKTALIDRGYDLRKYSFAMAVIHSSLKALMDSGDILVEVLKDDSKLYRHSAHA